EYDPLFVSKSFNNKKQPSVNRSEMFAASKNLEADFRKTVTEPSGKSCTNGGNPAELDLEDPNLFSAFNLPEVNLFNEMPQESKTKLLNSLPINVKSKYEYCVWSHKLNQLFKEQEIGLDKAN